MIKLFRTIVNILFVIIIAILLGYFALRVTDKIEIYNVKTGSMEEKIHVGDYILIFRKSSYNVGEVVTYTSDNGFITHRIIKKEGHKIITKGDANNAEDNEIIESSIVGEVIISGGILNIIINYKYIIVCLFLSLYLFSCYFGGEEKENIKLDIGDDRNELSFTTEEITKEEIKEEESDNSEKLLIKIDNNEENKNLEDVKELVKINNKEKTDTKEINKESKKKKTTNAKTKKNTYNKEKTNTKTRKTKKNNKDNNV